MDLIEDNICDLIDSFHTKYKVESTKLPYHFNLLDELHTDENVHSRLLLKILSYNENSSYALLKSFFEYLDGDFKKLEVLSPTFTAEKYRIDLLITDKKRRYAIVVENKIHGAIDQPEQINRYISHLQTYEGFSSSEIFVLYLTRNGGSPAEGSITKEEIEALKGRYKEISFRDDILPWLEKYALTNCPEKNSLFTSSVQQYIDHLNGMFHKRTIEKEMNEKLEIWISEQLAADLKSDFGKTEIDVIQKKKGQLLNLDSQLLNMLEDRIQLVFKGWKDMLVGKKQNFRFESNIVCNKPDKNYFYLGIKLRYQQVDFLCAIGLDNYTGDPYFGITYRGCLEEKSTIILSWVNNMFADQGYRETQRWYALKDATFSNVQNQYTVLLDQLLKIEGVTKYDF